MSSSLPLVTAVRRPMALLMKAGSAVMLVWKCVAAAVAAWLSRPSSCSRTLAAPAVFPPMIAPAKSRNVGCAMGAS
jgi:hypothetical protein